MSTAAGTLPFREVVELFAKAHNLSFMPNVRRGRVEGKQVYILGDHNVYMEDGVTWREVRRAPGAGAHGGAAEWEPVSLEALLPS